MSQVMFKTHDDDANDGDGGDDGDENVDDDDDGRLLLWQVMSPTPHALSCLAPLALSPKLHSCDEYLLLLRLHYYSQYIL